ncbi:hypothetical protein CJ030_MR0G007419 [Morella rubra]|uniref:Pentatricopeptide repeat-containing protein n=1 Tax=Morella rubra TaxID=262757 RepID=A0A6A1UKA1_9ROSI|nr:hypothetical protein CJ030_MR0G007419 [Morella rubra]
MASLPSVAVTRTLKLGPEFRKHPTTSSPTEKHGVILILKLRIVSQSPSISYQKNQTPTYLDVSSELRTLDFREALSMIKEGTKVESSYYVPLLQECIEKSSVSEAQIVHGHIMKTAQAFSNIKTFMCLCGHIKLCFVEHGVILILKLRIVSQSPSISYQKNQTPTYLDVSSELRTLDFREALSMIKEGTKVESSYYVPLLQECIEKSSVSEAQIVHGHIMKTGLQEDLFIMTFLINVYAKCGNIEYARTVFDNLPRRNVVSWTTLMTGYVHNLQPEVGVQVFQEMLEAGAYPTNYSLGTALNACSSLRSVKLGEQFHAYIVKYQIDFDTSVGNSLCSFYSKLGNLESAIKAFERIKEKNVISWTAVISACGDNGEAARGLKLFEEMLTKDIKPNVD